MSCLKHLWPFARKEEITVTSDQRDKIIVDWLVNTPSALVVKRNRLGTLQGLLKPEKATTYDGLTLRMLMTGIPITVKSLTRFMEAQLGNRTPNDVGASIRRVRQHLKERSIRLHECDVNPERGARHKKHWLDADQIGRLQKLGVAS